MSAPGIPGPPAETPAETRTETPTHTPAGAIDASAHVRRRRFAPAVWGVSALAAAVLVLGVTGTLSAWTSALITNDDNRATSGQSVILQETGPDGAGGTATCTSTEGSGVSNAYTCTRINKYGAAGSDAVALNPGDTRTSTVVLTNTGSATASTLTIAAGACASAYLAPLTGTPTLKLCDQLQVSVACTGDATFTQTAVSLTAFGAAGTQSFGSGLASGESTTCVFTVSLPASSGADYASQTATQDILWTLAV